MGKEAQIIGEYRRPHNDLEKQSYAGHGSIHDASIANKIGFKGAPIHGTVHFSQFAPLFLEAFGPQWFETGTISVHFKTPVTHLEPVRACMDRPTAPTDQVRIWMEKEDGKLVLEGTASGGGDQSRTTKARDQISKALAKPPSSELLILNGVRVGAISDMENVKIGFKGEIGSMFPFTYEDKLKIITEYHPWYTETGGPSSPWGAAILPPEMHNALMCYTMFEGGFLKSAHANDAISLFGGCEIRSIQGPMLADKAYKLDRKILALGETPKTEFVWTSTRLYEPSTGKMVAEMLLQLLFVKKSIKNYDQRRAALNPTKAKL